MDIDIKSSSLDNTLVIEIIPNNNLRNLIY